MSGLFVNFFWRDRWRLKLCFLCQGRDVRLRFYVRADVQVFGGIEPINDARTA